jgi:hypothetical protein
MFFFASLVHPCRIEVRKQRALHQALGPQSRRKTMRSYPWYARGRNLYSFYCHHSLLFHIRTLFLSICGCGHRSCLDEDITLAKMSNYTAQDGRWHRHSPVSRVEAVVIACTRDSRGDISYSAYASQGCSSGGMATGGGRGSG